MFHVTLPAGDVRDVEPCVLGMADIAAIRATVLPKLVRGSIVFPARPRYRLSGRLSAPGGHLFDLRMRHGAGLVVARIGIGWRDHGASLVWAAFGRRHMAEPRRPWVVDALDAAGVATLNAEEAARLGQWVSAVAGDLAWAATPPGAFLGDQARHFVEDDHSWEVHETRELGPATRDHCESDVAGELLLRPKRPLVLRYAAPVRADTLKHASATAATAPPSRPAYSPGARRAGTRFRSAFTKVVAQ